MKTMVVPSAASDRTMRCRLAVSVGGESGGRLVHDDEAGVARQGAQDLHLLLVRRGELPTHGIARHDDAGALDQLREATPQDTSTDHVERDDPRCPGRRSR